MISMMSSIPFGELKKVLASGIVGVGVPRDSQKLLLW